MHLADAAEVRVQQQTAAKSKLSSQIQDVPDRSSEPEGGERYALNYDIVFLCNHLSVHNLNCFVVLLHVNNISSRLVVDCIFIQVAII